MNTDPTSAIPTMHAMGRVAYIQTSVPGRNLTILFRSSTVLSPERINFAYCGFSEMIA